MIVHNRTVIQSEFLFVEDGEVKDRAPLQIPLDEFTLAEFQEAFERLQEARDNWEAEKCRDQ